MTVEQVIAEARRLSADERCEVMAAIDPASDALVMTDELAAELDRRWAEHMANPHDAITLDEFKAWLATGQE